MSNIKEDDSILINRNNKDFKITTQDLKNYVSSDDTYDGYLQADDLLLINDDGTDYNVRLDIFKEYSLSLVPEEPVWEGPGWENPDVGVWHIKNVTTKVTLNDFYTSWSTDGTDIDEATEREINEIYPGEEVVFITPKNSSNLFKENNVDALYELGPLTNTSKVTSIEGLFRDNNSFLGVGVEYMDTSNVENMSYVFYEANVFNQPIDSWNVEKVKSFKYLFLGANMFNQPLSSWVTSSLTTMEGCFRRALEFNQPIDHFDTSKVTHMGRLFMTCRDFNQPINSWDTSNVLYAHHMFENVVRFNQDLDNWDTSNWDSTNYMFHNSFDFNGNIGTWDTSNWGRGTYEDESPYEDDGPTGEDGILYESSAEGMFSDCSFNRDISGWNTSGWTNMSEMFLMNGVFNQDLSDWCVSKITRRPNGFATGAIAWTEPKPDWGSCPRGEDGARQVTTYNYTVTVNSTSYGNKYYLNGNLQQTIDALVGDTIVFDQSDSSNTGHPLKIYTDPTRTNEVTTGVTVDGSTTTFVVSEEGTFYYQCQIHSGMGSSITINT